MKVKDLQTFDVKACSPDTDLASAASTMWEHDCGVLPVVDDDHQVIGMITDRDICIAAGTRLSHPSTIRVGEVMAGNVYACGPDDDIRAALGTMKEQQVRRLPVVDARSQLVGILSMNDVVTAVGTRKADVLGDEVLATFKAICGPRVSPVGV